MANDPLRFLHAVAELKTTNEDGLLLFRPTRVQEVALRRMAQQSIREVLVDGGNRSGKTTLAAVFFASFIRNEPIRTWDGDLIHCRPQTKLNRPVTAWVIGDHLKHIGMTIYRLLLHPSPSDPVFFMVKDQVTGAMRAWSPERYPDDWDRVQEQVPSPPLIPAHVLDGEPEWAPGRKTANEFRSFTLKNKSAVFAFASSGEVKQGDSCDLIWNDENIVNKWYYEEWKMRLKTRSGMIMWSTIPRDSCFKFAEVASRLDDEQEDIDKGDSTEDERFGLHITMTMLESPFIPQSEKDLALKTMSDRDQLVRIYGKTSSRVIAVYQEYEPTTHCVWYGDDRDDRVAQMLQDNNWIPPKEWTRELILDPGTQKPAILLGAVPPPELWDEGEPYYVVYREIFIPRASPMQLADEVMKTEMGYEFERFIIDGHAGRQIPMGFVEKVEYQYSKAFMKRDLKSRQTSFGFTIGDDNFARRSNMVKHAMRMRPCRRPQLRILNQACPKLIKQLQTNVRKTTPDGEPTEEAANNQVDDLRVSLEYWISRKPTFVSRIDHIAIDKPDECTDPAYLAWKKRKQEAERSRRVAGSETIMIGA